MIFRDAQWHCESEKGEVAHSGKAGDIIYAFCALKEWVKRTRILATLILTPDPAGPDWMGWSFTQKEAFTWAPLFQAQSCISEVVWSDSDIRSSLKGFRHWHHDFASLAAMHAATLGLCDDLSFMVDPWLDVPNIRREAMVVFSRSHRYHNRRDIFPWRELALNFRENAVFIGSDSEYRDFTERAQCVIRRIDCRDLLEVAQVIAACNLFIGNQSAPLAIAVARRIPRIIEGFIEVPNCHWGQEEALEWKPGTPLLALVNDGLIERLIEHGQQFREALQVS